MANYVFEQVKMMIPKGALSLVDGDGIFRIALMTDALADAKRFSAYKTWDEIDQYEITQDPGYESKGYLQRPITGIDLAEIDDAGTSCDDGLPDTIVYANDIKFPVSTIDAAFAVITKTVTGLADTINTGDKSEIISSTDILIAAIDLRSGTPLNRISSNEGVFSIKLNKNTGGYFKLT